MEFTGWTALILFLAIAIIVSNILILLVLLRTEMLAYVNKYFFLSLTIADLGMGVFVVPFSFWTSLFQRWIYGDKFCLIEAYLAAIFGIGSVYSLTWLSIDHYVAIRKPDRYESIMTPTRCICWVVVIWVGTFSFCSPPLFGVSQAKYYKEAYLCIIDWQLQKAYFITSSMLLLLPPVIALTIANFYMFTEKYKEKKAAFEKYTDCNSRPEMYFVNFLVGMAYVVAWLPWSVLKLYETLHPDEEMRAPAALHFCLIWLAMSNCFFKFLIYVIFYHDFRIGLKILYTQLRCSFGR
ncbi:hypothetical protein CAPTEDRAFT_223097 [Capitella teleta]|uniref:G-protein coupled receptors family 1 profile domain-containing protein n=1 Tax=Capitella teleta TaxID=283909 RepID=R7V5W6_CAPTE|nr:hypothetical protein CAPTEDRAFT_223097 [Capitella teleta]|eukprot:ELU11716.1 hypothetical protein CAPTEDRAFT_223097 [Capitella teleta]